MPDISKIKLPSGTEYNIKDATARSQISQLQSYTKYLGVTTSNISDGSTTNPIVINNNNVTAYTGCIVNKGSKEFIFNGTSWQEFGDLSGLGSLAYKNSASGNYTPVGTITNSSNVEMIAITEAHVPNDLQYTPQGALSSAPTISLKTAGTTTTIKNPDLIRTQVSDIWIIDEHHPLPVGGNTGQITKYLEYTSVTGEVLSLNPIGTLSAKSIETSDVTVKTGDGVYQSSKPDWTGTPTGFIIYEEDIAKGLKFNGTQSTVTVS